MRNRLRALLVLVLLSVVAPGHAEPACGSDTSSDPDAALGKDVWLNGYCQAFLPCRLALEQFHGCLAAESFLSKLGAKQDVPLTEQQVQSALSQTAGAAADAPKAKAPMSRNIAGIERERVSEMDNKAAALVQSNCGGFGCSNLLESTVDPVIREAAALNANPEYLAHMPRYAPIASVEAAARFGWAKQDGYWAQAAPPQGQSASGGTSMSTLRDHLLSGDECKKLRDKLDQEIRSSAAKEPDNLSFFEGECVPQVASYADDVRRWRALMAARPPLPQTAGAAVNPPELGQWHNERVVEENRQLAEMEERREAEAQAQAEAHSDAGSAENGGGSGIAQSLNLDLSPQIWRGSGGLSFVASGNLVTTLDAEAVVSNDRQCGEEINDALHKHKVFEVEQSTLKLMIMAGKTQETFDPKAYYARRQDLTGRVLALLGKCAPSADRTLVAEKYSNMYRDSLARTTNQQGQGNSSASADPAAGDASCDAKFKGIDNQVSAATSGCGASASCNLEAAMWGLSQQISAIESYCPSGRYAAQLPDARKQLESVTTTCEQIVSGGRCSPKL